MYVRLVQFRLGPGRHSEAEAVADRVVPVIRLQKGCERCEFLTDYGSGDYGIVVFWASRQAADAGALVVGPILSEAMRKVNAVATIRLFDVYEPKG